VAGEPRSVSKETEHRLHHRSIRFQNSAAADGLPSCKRQVHSATLRRRPAAHVAFAAWANWREAMSLRRHRASSPFKKNILKALRAELAVYDATPSTCTELSHHASAIQLSKNLQSDSIGSSGLEVSQLAARNKKPGVERRALRSLPFSRDDRTAHRSTGFNRYPYLTSPYRWLPTLRDCPRVSLEFQPDVGSLTGTCLRPSRPPGAFPAPGIPLWATAVSNHQPS